MCAQTPVPTCTCRTACLPVRTPWRVLTGTSTPVCVLSAPVVTCVYALTRVHGHKYTHVRGVKRVVTPACALTRAHRHKPSRVRVVSSVA